MPSLDNAVRQLCYWVKSVYWYVRCFLSSVSYLPKHGFLAHAHSVISPSRKHLPFILIPLPITVFSSLRYASYASLGAINPLLEKLKLAFSNDALGGPVHKRLQHWRKRWRQVVSFCMIECWWGVFVVDIACYRVMDENQLIIENQIMECISRSPIRSSYPLCENSCSGSMGRIGVAGSILFFFSYSRAVFISTPSFFPRSEPASLSTKLQCSTHTPDSLKIPEVRTRHLFAVLASLPVLISTPSFFPISAPDLNLRLSPFLSPPQHSSLDRNLRP